MAAAASETCIVPPTVYQLTVRRGWPAFLVSADLATKFVAFASVLSTCGELSFIRIFGSADGTRETRPVTAEIGVLLAAFIFRKRRSWLLVLAEPTLQHMQLWVTFFANHHVVMFARQVHLATRSHLITRLTIVDR